MSKNGDVLIIRRLKCILTIFLCFALLLPAVSGLSAQAGTYFLQWPTPGNYGLTACYGDGRNHWAIDISGAKGSPVTAATSGYVTQVYTGCTHNYGKSYNCCNSIGNFVMLKYNGTLNNMQLETRYGHLTDIYVSVGQYVNMGDVIGTIGSTGYSTGNHLDFKTYFNGTPGDPAPFLQTPTQLYYAGRDWDCCGPYLQKMKSYNNTSYGGTPVSNITLSAGYNYPILIKQGSSFSIKGTVSSSNSLSSVTARITTVDGNVRSEKTVFPGTKSFALENIASALSFSSLPAGYYVYEVLAKDSASSTDSRLLSINFTVSSNATMVAMMGHSYPTSLKPGNDFNITGTIASINTIAALSVAVVDTNNNAVIMKSKVPNSTLYDLAEFNKDLNFATLPEGTYYYRVNGMDNAGNKYTIIDYLFYVTNKIGLFGDIDIGGLSGAPFIGVNLRLNADISPEDGTYNIQWYADSQPIPGATYKTYSPTFAYSGKAISVKITGNGNYYGEIESAPTNKVIRVGEAANFRILIVEERVSPAPLGTTVGELMDGLISNFMFTGIYDKKGNKLSNDDVLVTGYELKLVGLFGVTVYRYFIVVQGDIDSDGEITATDARKALRASAQLEKLSIAQKGAADVDVNGEITAVDARAILRASAGLEALPPII